MRLPDPRDRPWLTVAEVADITGEGTKAIRAAVKAGHVPSLHVGRYIRIPTAALFELVGLSPDGSGPMTPDMATADASPASAAALTDRSLAGGSSDSIVRRSPLRSA